MGVLQIAFLLVSECRLPDATASLSLATVPTPQYTKVLLCQQLAYQNTKVLKTERFDACSAN